jgi:hypothetical protein
VYWLSLCRDIDPRHTLCAENLCKQYISMGQLEPALTELMALLKAAPASEEAVVELIGTECNIPGLVVDLFAKKALIKGITAPEAMFFFVMVCSKQVSINQPTSLLACYYLNVRYR